MIVTFRYALSTQRTYHLSVCLYTYQIQFNRRCRDHKYVVCRFLLRKEQLYLQCALSRPRWLWAFEDRKFSQCHSNGSDVGAAHS